MAGPQSSFDTRVYIETSQLHCSELCAYIINLEFYHHIKLTLPAGRRRCCLAVQGFLKPACNCEESVLRVASGQGIGPAELHTVMRAALLGCGFAKSIMASTC